MRTTPLLAAAACAVALPASAGSTYLALGDSITFGETDLRYVQSDGDQGYVELYADYLGSIRGERPNVVNLAIDGETTDSFVDNTGRVPPVVGRTDIPLQLQNTSYQPDDRPPQQELFRRTLADQRAMGNTIDTVSITLGFNDLAAVVPEPNSLELIDPTLAVYRENYDDILADIRSELPDADLFVLGYFNPFPADPESPAAPVFAEGGPQLNAIIEDLAARYDAFYVDTATPFLGREAELTFIDEFPAGSTVPLPHPFGPGIAPIGNVHPNAAGYRVIANQLIAVPTPSAVGLGAAALLIGVSRRRRAA